MIDRDVASEAKTEVAANTAADAPAVVDAVIRRICDDAFDVDRRITEKVIAAVNTDVPSGRSSRHRRHHRRILEAAAAVEIRSQRTLRNAQDECRADEKYLTRRKHVISLPSRLNAERAPDRLL